MSAMAEKMIASSAPVAQATPEIAPALSSRAR